MTDKTVAVIAATSIVAIIFLYKKQNKTTTNAAPVAPEKTIVQNSFVQSSPAQILNGGPNTFNSVNNISVNPDAARWLSQQYIPMFGFVGVAQ